MKIIDSHINIGQPFVISRFRERPSFVHAFPHAWRTPAGRIFLSISKERDIHDMERFLLKSDDCGQSWQETDDWPTARFPGSYPGASCAAGNGRMIVCLNASFADKDGKGLVVPTWFSNDNGSTWSPMQDCRLHIADFELGDIYDHEWRSKSGYAQKMMKLGFLKPYPPAALLPLFKKYSTKRGPSLFRIVAIGGECLLGLMIASLNPGEKSSVIAVISEDFGRNWHHLSVVARYSQRYADKTIGEEDGFDEPTILRFPDGELLVIMRMGSFYPLYAVRSGDNGKTWTEPEKMSICGVLPTAVLLDNDILALATGRPDVTLNFNHDRGKSWGNQTKLLDSSKGERSTSNVALIKLEGNKLLYIYDSFDADPAGKDYWLREHGFGRVLGRFIEIKPA